MCLFIETIRIEGGEVKHAAFHNRRLNDTRRNRWGCGVHPLRVEDYITPAPYKERTRCRLTYGREVAQVEYFPYHRREVHTLRLVEADEVSYAYKYADRTPLDLLFDRRDTADDVLIVRRGLLTDTSIANIALLSDDGQWYTPLHPLLPGTHRRRLLESGLLLERDIPARELCRYRKLRLFNAMLHWGEIELHIPEAILG